MVNTYTAALRRVQRLIAPAAASQEYDLYWEYARNQSELFRTHGSADVRLPATTADSDALEYICIPEIVAALPYLVCVR